MGEIFTKGDTSAQAELRIGDDGIPAFGDGFESAD